MRWRWPIAIAVLAAAVPWLLAPPAPAPAADKVDGPQVTWNTSVWGGRRAVTEGIEKLAELVSERTGGKFTIKVHYAEALSPSRENLDGLKLGAFEGAHFCSSYHPGKTPAMTALDLPFLPLPSIDVIVDVHEAYAAHPAVAKELAQWNTRFLMATPLPQYEFMGSGNPPLKLADWRGRRVRALGGLGDAMRALGAVPTTVPAPEVYTSLERGVVDAASFPFTYAHGAYKLHEVSRWYTSNLAPGTVFCPIGVTLGAWEALPPQYKKVIEDSKPEAYEAMKVAYAKADERWLPLFKERGLVDVRYSEAELEEFRKIGGQPVWDKWVTDMQGRGLPARELLDLALSTARKAAQR